MDNTLTLTHPDNIAATPLIVTPLPVPDVLPKRLMPWSSHELRVPNQPSWLSLYRTARPALNSTLWNRVSVSLFHFESNCLHYGLSAPKKESDEARFARWCLGADRAIKRRPVAVNWLPSIVARIGIHDDDPRQVAEILRINSAVLILDPTVSNRYFYQRHLLPDAIKSGAVGLFCGADGWGTYLDTRKLHAGPGRALPDGTQLLGPHLPNDGDFALGRNRPFWRPGAQYLTDDLS